MVMDYTAITEGIVSGLATHHLARLTSEEKTEIHTQALIDLAETLKDLHIYLLSQVSPSSSSDVFQIVTLFKVGQGNNWIPLLGASENRRFVRVMVIIPTVILLTSPLAPPTTITLPAINPVTPWLPFDYPDGTSIILDPTASANQLNIWVKYTDIPPDA